MVEAVLGRSDTEVRNRIAIATRAILNLRSIWKDKVKNSPTWDDCDFQTFYGSETWTLTSEMERKILAFEMRACMILLQIPRTAFNPTNVEVRSRIDGRLGKIITYEKL